MPEEGDAIDVAETFRDDWNEEREAGEIAALYGESISYNKASGEEEGLDD